MRVFMFFLGLTSGTRKLGMITNLHCVYSLITKEHYKATRGDYRIPRIFFPRVILVSLRASSH